MAAARLQRVVYLLLSSFGVGHVAVSVIGILCEHHDYDIEFDFGLIWHYSSKTSPKLGYMGLYSTS